MTTKIPYKQPEYRATAFNCPFCNAFANQIWRHLSAEGNYIEGTEICLCSHCKNYSVWHEELMVYPEFSGVEPPNADLNRDIQHDYLEAASIVHKSPRGAAALLRLAIQKLCVQLGETGGDLNIDIGNLTKQGLPPKVQQSLDALRVIGNEAVHPGQLDLRDDIKTATSLFGLLNFIAEKMITEPKEIEAIYAKIPENKKRQIKDRDNK